MNLTTLKNAYRLVTYSAAVAAGFAVAGYSALGDGLPDWLIFANAGIATLSGGIALGNFTPSENADSESGDWA